LVEVLIITLILCVIGVVAASGFQERLVRKRVASVKAEMRMLSVALEGYAVDCNIYPAWGIGHPGPGAIRSANFDVAQRTGNRSGVGNLPSFLLNDLSVGEGRFFTLTYTLFGPPIPGGGLGWLPPPPGTPPSHYIVDYPKDAFCIDQGSTFVYWSSFPGAKNITSATGGLGWITVSPGPDRDCDIESCYGVYDPAKPQPSPLLLAGTNPRGSSFTYDPTNGTVSDGDLYRHKM
jgi:hypothetical protein